MISKCVIFHFLSRVGNGSAEAKDLAERPL